MVRESLRWIPLPDKRTTSKPRFRWERRVPGDACIIDEDVDGSKVRLDLLQALGAFLVIGHVPFIGRDARLGLEFRGGCIVTVVSCRDVISRCLQSRADGRTDPTRPAAHYCTRAIFISPDPALRLF